MISTSDAYKSAVVGDVRRTCIQVPLRLISPELEVEAVTASAEAAWSVSGQIHDEVTAADRRYATLEDNYWSLDGAVEIMEGDSPDFEVGYVSDALCGADGVFASPVTVSMAVSGISALQAVSLYFPDDGVGGVAEDFVVTVSQGGVVYAERAYTGNTDSAVLYRGFTVYDPDTVTLTVTKWSVPYRRMRLIEMIPGYMVTLTERDLKALHVKMQASVNAMSLPYGTAYLVMDNTDRLFDPRNKDGLFRSLEARNGIPIRLGVRTGDGIEYIPCGVFYKQDRAWSTQDDNMTMRWDLVDILGLLSRRAFLPPDTLPGTLEGWVAALVSQLGDTFAGAYTVDSSVAATSLTASAADLDGKPCGDILRWLCQATGTFARADQETGYLAVEPYWSQGNEYTLDNLESLPTVSANDDISAITFRLTAGDMVVSGNTETSANTITVDNPFVRDQPGALTAARHILSAYGGSKLSLVGRGDPSSEIGDVVTVQLDPETAVTARLISQTLDYTGGVLKSCRSELVQPDGGTMYEERVFLAESGTWTAPAGVTRLHVVLVGGGQGGGRGMWGIYPDLIGIGFRGSGWYYGKAGDTGEAGAGGKVWYGDIQINPGQRFAIHVGAGGAAGSTWYATDGEATTFGAYSSANGRVYTPAYTDIYSGSAYGRTGVRTPADNSGDGGAGGAGGSAPAQYWEQTGEHTYTWRANQPGSDPQPGTAGASGCVIIYYDKEGET